MKISIASLAIGIGIGVAIAAVVVVVFVMQPGRIILDNDESAMATIASSNGTYFFMSGIIKEMSNDTMIIDQMVGVPNLNDRQDVKIRLDRGGAFVGCRGTGVPNETCRESVVSRIDEGIHVCSLTRLYNGEFYAGKMWADAICGPFTPPATE